MATAGGFLMFVGIKDVPFRDGLREMLAGKVPEGEVKTPSAFRSMASQALFSGAGGGISGGGVVNAGFSGSVSGPNAGIARTALGFLGVPYIWGGTTPKGFDCSGLVQYTLKLNGVDIGRTTYQQEVSRKLTKIPRQQLAAGDLVFWPGHVAIAISATEVVHAPGTGKVVKTAPLDQAGPRGLSPTSYQRVKTAADSGGTSTPPPAASKAPPKAVWT